MAYAKPCKFCNKISIVWRKEGDRNIPVEAMTMEDHTREKCDAAKAGQGQQQEQRQPMNREKIGVGSPQKQEATRQVDTDFFAIYGILERQNTKVDNLNIAIAKVMSQNETIITQQVNLLNNPTQRENQILKQKVTELEEVLKRREDNFVPANQVKQQQEEEPEPDSYAIRPNEEGLDHDQHVRDMVAKGKQAEEESEELEI